MDSRQTSQASLDPAKTPVWYLDHATKLHRDAEQQLRSESDSSKVVIFLRQCKYLVEHLGTAIHISRKSWERSLSPEHKCGGALELLCRLAKEVQTFVWECCNGRWMQAALTSASVPEHVSSWRWRLKVCSELLWNSNKLGAAWLTIGQHGALGEEEQLKIKEMALEDEGDLRRLLKSMLDQSNKSELNVLIRNVELVRTILKRLGACHDGMLLSKVDLENLLQKERVDRKSQYVVFEEGEWFGAIKVAIADYFWRNSVEVILHEMAMGSWLSHPNIVAVLGYIKYGNEGHGYQKRCSKILEFMDGDLETLMEQRMQEDGNRESPFSIWEACDLMLQVAEGVRYMHQNRVVHRNLKCSSIQVGRFIDHTLEYIYAKVYARGDGKRIEKSITNSVQTAGGSSWYSWWMAPELMPERMEILNTTQDMLKIPFKSDVFSFAMVCTEILTGEHPFQSLQHMQVRKKVLEGVRPTLPLNTPLMLRNLIKLCWDPDPTRRPSFAEICKELWYIRCSLIVEPQDLTPQLPLPPPEPLCLPPELSNFKGEYSSLKVVRKFGSGGSDMVTVYLSALKLQPAIEVAQKRFMGSHNECFINEVTIMAELKHSNVVSLLRYASDRRSCSIVMELMDGDLYDLMYRRWLEGKVTLTGPFSMADAVHVILEIARGMEYVHGKYVVHRDLKSCNILIKNASEGGKLEVKVADFGLSKKLSPPPTLLGKEESGVGTMRWMAPEVMAPGPSFEMYDPFKSDVFSFGMLCYEILVGKVPFYAVEKLDTVKKNVLDGGRPTLPEWTPSHLKELIEKCWVKEASERPTFADIVGELTKARV